jgi:hypothetical protein
MKGGLFRQQAQVTRHGDGLDAPVRAKLGVQAVNGPAVQLSDSLILASLQSCLQHLGEQGVIAIPNTLVIQGGDEQVGLLHVLQHCLSAGIPRDCIAQGSAQALQIGGFQQEIQRAWGALVEHFLRQIPQDMPVAARKGPDEPWQVVVILHGERRDLQTGNLALGAPLQGFYFAG